jgi:hypothetical protein
LNPNRLNAIKQQGGTKMRRVFFAAAILASSLGFAQTKVKVDGIPVNFDVAPRMVNGQLMVPARHLFDKMGLTLEWRPESEMFMARGSNLTMELRIHDRVARINDEEAPMDEAPYVTRGRLMVPLKMIVKATGSMMSNEKGWIKVMTPKRK